MQIAGLVKTSLIDYPGLLSAVVFTQGCNFRCGFCHNPDLIPSIGNTDTSEIEFFEFLESRRNVLEGVVITGGEPTIQPDLMQFISRIRDHRLKIKLDTNGSNPETLKRLLETNLIDYIAMDIKGPFEGYNNICRFGEIENIKECIEIVEKSGLPYEFRTTVLPAYHKIEDFEMVGDMIRGAERFAVQGFRSDVTFDKSLKDTKAFTIEELNQIAEIMQKYVKEVVVRDNLR
jgi:pyruvate formate lyase activating enzyme